MYHDFVIQLKNGALARKKEIITRYSNLDKAIAQVLKHEGFLSAVAEDTIDGKRVLIVTLRYQRRKPAITDVKLISKPSLRTYVGMSDIIRKQGRSATAILSTNVGVLTGKNAVKQGIGGELLFTIW